MARPLRLEHAGALWHVTTRGNERRAIFRDDEDRDLFLSNLGKVVDACRWRLHAYVLMPNHYHLLVETPEPNLSKGMQRLNGRYSQRFNRRHQRVGHLMQGRFKSILVEQQRHLLAVARYIVLNPVRARLTRTAGQWEWSNYRATALLTEPPRWLEIQATLREFDADDLHRGSQLYRQFVSEAEGSSYSPWDDLRGQICLGGESFRRKIQELILKRQPSPEHPSSQRRCVRPSIETIRLAVSRAFDVPESILHSQRRGPGRPALALLARTEAALPLRRIGEALEVGASGAGYLIVSAEKMLKNDPDFGRRLAEARKIIAKTVN
jgi:REP element-mobilizing transposase RayT